MRALEPEELNRAYSQFVVRKLTKTHISLTKTTVALITES